MSLQKYECIICMDLCQKPISCQRCTKLICLQHSRRIDDRCPHCRLEPYQFMHQVDLGREIELMRRQEKERMKRENVFKCLVEGCNFEGRYHSMVVHRRSKHFGEKIDEILFPEERKKKYRRDALKKLFVYLDDEQKREQEYHQRAVKIYAGTKGRCELPILKKLLVHLDKCKDPSCKQVEVGDEYAYIGVVENDAITESMCPVAKALKTKLEE